MQITFAIDEAPNARSPRSSWSMNAERVVFVYERGCRIDTIQSSQGCRHARIGEKRICSVNISINNTPSTPPKPRHVRAPAPITSIVTPAEHFVFSSLIPYASMTPYPISLHPPQNNPPAYIRPDPISQLYHTHACIPNVPFYTLPPRRNCMHVCVCMLCVTTHPSPAGPAQHSPRNKLSWQMYNATILPLQTAKCARSHTLRVSDLDVR